MLKKHDVTLVYLSFAFAPHWRHGGPPRIIYTYYDFVRNRCLNSVQVISTYEPVDKDFIIDDSIYYLPNTGLLGRFYYGVPILRLVRRLLKLRSTSDKLIIHLSQTRSVFNLLALIFSFFNNVSLVFSPFGSLPNRRSVFNAIYDIFVTKPFVRRCSLGLGQTNHELNVLQNFGAKRVKLGLLGTPAHQYGRSPGGRVKKGLTQFLYLGRFHKSKGVIGLISAFSELVNTRTDWRLDIVGAGSEQSKMEDLINSLNLQEYVNILPPVYDDSRFELYSSYDFYVINSEIYEETSLASVEALSVGVPSIVNERVDLPFLEQFNAGYVVRKGNNLHSVITHACQLSDEDIKEMKRSALDLFENKYSSNAVCLELCNNYKDLLE